MQNRNSLVVALLALSLATTSWGSDRPLDADSLKEYFPFRLGDSWTYDWEVEESGGPVQRGTRTRSFEGTEFVGTEMGYKLVRDDGAFSVYTFEDGAVRLHSSTQRGQVYLYDPPVLVAGPELSVAEAHVAEDSVTGRTWRTTLLGFEDVTVPLGRFEGCLKIRMEMEDSEYREESVHLFAPHLGMVAYEFAVWARGRPQPIVRTRARLRLARIDGRRVASMDDVAALVFPPASSPAGRDDPTARQALRLATDSRYTWDQDFGGFSGRFELVEAGMQPATGRFEIDSSLTVSVAAGREAIRAAVFSQLSSYVAHRKPNPFDLAFATVSFSSGGRTEDGGLAIVADGDTMGTSYVVRDGQILRVGRSVGRLRFEAENLEHLSTHDGRQITVVYTLSYYSNEDDSLISKELFRDTYARFDDDWLPTGRRVVRVENGQEVPVLELRLSALEPH